MAAAEQRRILVVEDDPSVRRLTELILRRAGFMVDLAENGAVALDRLHQRSYDLVVLDLMMPVMSGFDFLDAVSTKPEMKGLHVVVLTAASDRDISRAGGAVVCEVMRKPFDVDEFRAAVKRCLDGDHQGPDRNATKL